jgi:hypothetical protein
MTAVSSPLLLPETPNMLPDMDILLQTPEFTYLNLDEPSTPLLRTNYITITITPLNLDSHEREHGTRRPLHRTYARLNMFEEL